MYGPKLVYIFPYKHPQVLPSTVTEVSDLQGFSWKKAQAGMRWALSDG